MALCRFYFRTTKSVVISGYVPYTENGKRLFCCLKEPMRLFYKYVLPILISLVILFVWEVTVFLRDIPRFILPAPSKILVTLVVERSQLLHHSWVTLQEMLYGFLLAIGIGIPLGILMFEFPVLERAFYPYVIGSQTVPVFAIAPLLIVWFGFGIASKVIMAAIIVFFAIVLTTLQGLKSTDPDIIDLFRIHRATRWQILWKVRLPDALPFIFSGAKIGIAISTIGAVIGEWVGAEAGLGFLMLYANSRLQVSLVFAAILCLTVLGLVLFAFMTLLEKLAMPWRRKHTDVSNIR